jgi:tetratricopeptide (TPR) repeat protein
MPAPTGRPIKSTTISPRRKDSSYDCPRYRRAQEYLRSSAWDDAIQELKDAIELNPQQADYHALLGIAYFKRNLTADKSMAKVYLKRALSLEPHHPLANKYYSACVGKSVNKAVNADSDDRHHYRQAQAHIAQKAWDQAVQELKAAIRLDLRRADYHALLGAVYLKIAKETEKLAKVYLQRALKIEPNHPLATEHYVAGDDPDEYDLRQGNKLDDGPVGGIAPSPRPRRPRPTLDSDGAMALPDSSTHPPLHPCTPTLSNLRSLTR